MKDGLATPLDGVVGKRRMGWPVVLLCSRNAHDQNVLVRRAQWEAKQAPLQGEGK